MKRKICLLLSALLVITVSFSTPIYASQVNPFDIDKYSAVYDYSVDIADNFNTLHPSDQETRTVLSNSRSDILECDESGRIVAYKSAQTSQKACANLNTNFTMAKSTIPFNLDRVLSECVENYEDFSIIQVDTVETGFRVYLERKINTDLSDYIDISLDHSGKLRWVVVNYCNLEFISESQKRQLEEQLTEYIKSLSIEYLSYKTNVLYTSKGNQIIAVYTIIYTHEDGTYSTEVISANIPL